MKIKHLKEPLRDYPIGVHIGAAIQYIDDVFKLIKEEVINRNVNIWVRGSSGAILSALLANKLWGVASTVDILHVKKKGESSHSSPTPRINHSYKAINIILDDFSTSGETVDAIYTSMSASRITKVDYLILGDLEQHLSIDNVPFKFVPVTLITHEDVTRKEWENLKPTK